MNAKILARIAYGAWLLVLTGCLGASTFTVPTTQKRIGNLGFSIDIPYPGCRMETSFHDQGIVNYDFYLDSKDFKPAKVFSVEWVPRRGQPTLSEKEIYEYWNTFTKEYLTKNFQNGKYDIVFSQPWRLNNQYPAAIVIGSGHHNGGRAGSIYLIWAYIEHHWVMMYSLNTNVVTKDDPCIKSVDSLSMLPAFDKFLNYAQSFDEKPAYMERK